jgi:hypothetical protein
MMIERLVNFLSLPLIADEDFRVGCSSLEPLTGDEA